MDKLRERQISTIKDAVRPVVELLDRVYEKGVRIAKKAFQKIEQRLKRDESLHKYFRRIQTHGT